MLTILALLAIASPLIVWKLGRGLHKAVTTWETSRINAGKPTHMNALIPAATTIFGTVFGVLFGAVVVTFGG